MSACSRRHTPDVEDCDVLMLYELLTGEAPFGESTPIEAARRLGNGERPSVDGIDESDVRRVMVRMWSEDANDRPSLKEVMEEMRRIGGLRGRDEI